jgi:hypothetical protein
MGAGVDMLRVALIVGWGFLPLPVVGIWMLPVGLALLAHDIPIMRAPIARLLHFTNRKIEERKSCLSCSAFPISDTSMSTLGHKQTFRTLAF